MTSRKRAVYFKHLLPLKTIRRRSVACLQETNKQSLPSKITEGKCL